jgi:hypothetical protein
MAEKERADGSKKFKLQGGPYDKLIVRLYPSNDGWERLQFAVSGATYVAPDEQPARGKPVLNWVEDRA